MRATRQRFRALAAVSVAAALLAAGCGSDSGSSSDTTAAAAAETTAAAGGDTTAAAGGETTAAAGGDLTALVDEATKEGKVNLIALPDSWANYKGILQSFRDKYPGIENPVATPDASSAEELTAVKTLAGQADMPDTIDVGPPFAIQAKDEGLWEPYKASTWDEVPDALKDPDGNWVGAYYGIMAIGTNTTLVKNAPKTFADLKKPEYKGQVALNGDPR
jgi:putative spermidine/putrescine transport system substrate-binding protein